ncbi:hypothetical protein GCM10025884_06320 [Leuconostoc gelidum subsp. gelidum]|nr:hypothetical protein GCM10025884_06320 [Leuconostoc gelidum subsp. gelidum]
MKAALVRETPDGYVDLINDWTPKPLTFGEALVDMEYVGLCHTDLHVAGLILAIQMKWGNVMVSSVVLLVMKVLDVYQSLRKVRAII